MWRAGEFETFTEAWVEIRHIRYGRPLVEAKTQPNSLPLEKSFGAGCRRQWLHTTLAAALSALRCRLVLAHEDSM
eukprot:1213186-Prorocentrum_lima.AAC.1